MLFSKTNKEFLSLLNEKIEGHIEAKKAVINLISRATMRHYQKFERQDDSMQSGKLLLIGGSGTGKTYLIETLKELTDFPFFKIDATRLTQTSAKDGVNSEELENRIIARAQAWVSKQKEKGNTSSLEGALDKTVVFIDEIDKLAYTASDDWNSKVQANFLTLFENTTSLKGVSFIFAGAFTQLRNNSPRNGIGFFTEKYKKETNLEELLVQYGLLEELVGRLTNIVELDTLTEEQYINILNNQLLPKVYKELKAFNISEFEINKEQLVKNAMDSNQGVRFLKRELNKLVLDVEFNYEENNIQQVNGA